MEDGPSPGAAARALFVCRGPLRRMPGVGPESLGRERRPPSRRPARGSTQASPPKFSRARARSGEPGPARAIPSLQAPLANRWNAGRIRRGIPDRSPRFGVKVDAGWAGLPAARRAVRRGVKPREGDEGLRTVKGTRVAGRANAPRGHQATVVGLDGRDVDGGLRRCRLLLAVRPGAGTAGEGGSVVRIGGAFRESAVYPKDFQRGRLAIQIVRPAHTRRMQATRPRGSGDQDERRDRDQRGREAGEPKSSWP